MHKEKQEILDNNKKEIDKGEEVWVVGPRRAGERKKVFCVLGFFKTEGGGVFLY